MSFFSLIFKDTRFQQCILAKEYYKKLSLGGQTTLHCKLIKIYRILVILQYKVTLACMPISLLGLDCLESWLKIRL